MAIQVQGNSGAVTEVEANSLAMRALIRPDDALGVYSKGLVSGGINAGLAAGANVAEFRWTDATKICLVRKVMLSCGCNTGFAAGLATFKLFVARSFSASGSGGTAGTLTGNIGKLRTSMPPTQLGDMRVILTSALTAGTWTLDTDPIGAVTTSVTTTAGQPFLAPTNLLNCGPGLYPLNLVSNEGFTIQATVPGTGTWVMSCTVEWEELAAAASYQ